MSWTQTPSRASFEAVVFQGHDQLTIFGHKCICPWSMNCRYDAELDDAADQDALHCEKK